MNIFELASRSALRFPSSRGPLTTEQLWGIPLKSKSGFDLDHVARSAYAEVQALDSTSFVDAEVSPAKADAELRMEIVKHVIASKQAAAKEAADASARRAEREKLLNILQNKKDEQLASLSIEELEARIAKA